MMKLLRKVFAFQFLTLSFCFSACQNDNPQDPNLYFDTQTQQYLLTVASNFTARIPAGFTEKDRFSGKLRNYFISEAAQKYHWLFLQPDLGDTNGFYLMMEAKNMNGTQFELIAGHGVLTQNGAFQHFKEAFRSPFFQLKQKDALARTLFQAYVKASDSNAFSSEFFQKNQVLPPTDLSMHDPKRLTLVP